MLWTRGVFSLEYGVGVVCPIERTVISYSSCCSDFVWFCSGNKYFLQEPFKWGGLFCWDSSSFWELSWAEMCSGYGETRHPDLAHSIMVNTMSFLSKPEVFSRLTSRKVPLPLRSLTCGCSGLFMMSYKVTGTQRKILTADIGLIWDETRKYSIDRRLDCLRVCLSLAVCTRLFSETNYTSKSDFIFLALWSLVAGVCILIHSDLEVSVFVGSFRFVISEGNFVIGDSWCRLFQMLFLCISCNCIYKELLTGKLSRL